MMNFIVNISSGKKSSKVALAKCIDICIDKQLAYSVHFTERVGHAEEIARELSAKGAELIVAVGGDGTFHEVLNGIDPSITTLGFVPAGSGNDFALASGLSLNPTTAFNNILSYDRKAIDYINVNDRRCINVAGTGMDVDVLEAVYEKKGLTYITSLLSCITKFKPYYTRIKVNGTVIDKKAIIVGVCNGIAIGGGIKMSPNSKINDGKLDIIIMEQLDRPLMKIVGDFKKGKHMDFPETTHIKTDEIEIINYGKDPALAYGEDVGSKIQLDGEIYEGVPFKCKIVSGGLTVKGIK